MIDCLQFRELIIRPSLKAINLYSVDAEELLIATMAQETLGGQYIKQLKGPALGIYQMEPSTYNDIWSQHINNNGNLTLRSEIISYCNFHLQPAADEMISNLKLSTIMARIFYSRITIALPDHTIIDDIWAYYKKHWNTEDGDAKKYDFIRNYQLYLGKEHA